MANSEPMIPQDMTLLDEFEQDTDIVIGILDGSLQRIDKWQKDWRKTDPQRTTDDLIEILESFYPFRDTFPRIRRFLTNHKPEFKDRVEAGKSNIDNKIQEIVSKCSHAPYKPPLVEMCNLRGYIEELADDLRFCVRAVKEKQQPQQKDGYEAYIKKGGFGFGGKKVWEFGFGGKKATINSSLKGLVLIEYLLQNKFNEYKPLELLKAVGQREESESEPEKIYSPKDIKEIKKAIEGLKQRAKLSDDPQEKDRLEKEVEKAEGELHKTRNCRGDSRKISERYTKSVTRKINTVLQKISPQNLLLYNHLDTFLKRGEICYYKPDIEISWEIS